jgi:hypothetical protein
MGGGGHKSTPVKHKHQLFPPARSSPLMLAWQVNENGEYLKLQNYRLDGTTVRPVPSFRIQGSYMSATSQARLNGGFGLTSMYETFLMIPAVSPLPFPRGPAANRDRERTTGSTLEYR